MQKKQISDVLANRYASPAMCEIWSMEGRVLQERQFWIAVMKAQKDLGLDVPQDAIDAYEAQQHDIRLDRIQERERVLRHDVKSRIEEFCELAGHEHIHKGMTSRDLTDNVEQLQVRNSVHLVLEKSVAALSQLANWASQEEQTLLVGRTHNVPAQPTTLGKRLAMFGQEMLVAFEQLEQLHQNYPLRGVQGAVGTQLDQWTLFQQQEQATQQLNERIQNHLGFAKSLNAVGQVYPRSLDHWAISALYALSSGITSLAKTLRLMAGHQLVNEGFQKGQVGSSAMPHKMNTRNLERICGFHTLLNGYLNMVMGLSGDQWNEGDVSCSVVRRVALPGAFFAMDGQLETLMTVFQEMGFYQEALVHEVKAHLPFLATTTLLMEAVKKGLGREEGHEIIKHHAVQVAHAIQRKEGTSADLIAALAQDTQFPLNLEEIQETLDSASNFLACAPKQVQTFVGQVQTLQEHYPQFHTYKPEPLL